MSDQKGIILELTYREAAALDRWNRLHLWSFCYYQPHIAASLASKGLVEVVGWSNGNGEKREGIMHGESVPGRFRLVPTGQVEHGRVGLQGYDINNGRTVGSLCAVCKLTSMGKKWVSKYGDDWRSRMKPNRSGVDPLIVHRE